VANRSEAPRQIGSPATWALITDMLSDPHARARAFGVDSVLQLPFPAAVKTGTSSNYRDTWTVGFTRDYTVATWVGNFNGAPMRNVSGVTGAAPLWQKIMLHLHQTQEPTGFTPPTGMVLRPICALSGYKPNPACPSVVQEYLPVTELPRYQQQPDPVFAPMANGRYRLNLPREYNAWLIQQPRLWAMANLVTPVQVSSPPRPNPVNTAESPLQIAFPQPGDYFLWSGGGQTLQFQLTTSPQQPVRWRLNGQLLAEAQATRFTWPLRPGRWTLEVESDGQVDRVNFEVQAAAGSEPARRGFSVVGEEPK
jgi:penicillin-binding protein 1C